MLLEYLALASGLNFTFLAFVLFRQNKRNNKSAKILIRLLLFMALYSTFVFYHYLAADKGLKVVLSYYLPVDGILLATLAPCLYYYVMATIKTPVSRSWKALLLHSIAFVPFIAFNIYFASLTRSQRVDWLLRDFHVGTLENNLLNAVLYTQIIVYLWVSYVQVKRKIKQPCTNNIDAGTENYNWLKKYLLINIVYTTVSIPFCFYFANERTNIIIGQLAMNIQFVYLFFRKTKNNEQSSNPHIIENNSTLKTRQLNSEAADIQLTKLAAYMEEHKPYLDEACSIQSIADNIGISLHQLSHLLNCKLQKTFPDYINEYRIRIAQQLLLSKKSANVTIESIVHDCGFGSKSTFNRAFKKFSQNQTPTEFIQNQESD